MDIVKNKIVTSTDHYQGPDYASIEVVQYGDFLCSDCGETYTVIKSLQDKMGDNMKFIFRHYPMRTIHPLSIAAAVATEAAAQQGKFWYMHDMIFENQKHLERNSFSRFAEEIGLCTRTFEDNRGFIKLFHKVINDFELSRRKNEALQIIRFEGFFKF